MKEIYRKKFHKLLMEFSNGTTPCRKHLLKRYKELVDEAIELGLICQCGMNDDRDPIYTITTRGREIRDN